ncbi:MAG: M3 family oligoendopeptidase [Firmicutes bacterium]|nr:M3 family oligoendopeptidase [Bacillota bacterium]
MDDLMPVWELESIFPGGSGSAELERWLAGLAEELAALQKSTFSSGSTAQWQQRLERIQDAAARLSEAAAFVSCLCAQDVQDDRARLLNGRLEQLRAALGGVMTALDEKMLELGDDRWRRLLEQPEIAPLAFPLAERRNNARKKMAAFQEKLVVDLAVDGYHGWSNQYNLIAGRIRIPWEQQGRQLLLSTGQAANYFADPDPAVRAAMAERWVRAWADEAELCASVLNHLGGFRLNLYRHRGWDDILEEPLTDNRISGETLKVMWAAVEQNRDILREYLRRKQGLLGLQELSWFDLDAPLGKVSGEYTYTRACRFVMEQLAVLCPKMAHFCATAFQKRWVEGEDRPGKRAGAFCSSFPVSGQSRVFMTFAGTPANLSTLAHEMGHAYHHQVIADLPFLARRYPMSVAESASTFAEMVVADAAVRRAATPEVKIALLDGKLKNGVSYFMDIESRFLFESAFYEKRSSGPVGVAELNRLMLAAQDKAYRGSFDRYQPYFWASKLHFYLTRAPFYNFPYTFGYLFSAGIFALARETGSAFEERYIDLLRDTGRMSVEDLAAKHLGVDLSRPTFWQRAAAVTAADAAEFLQLTE